MFKSIPVLFGLFVLMNLTLAADDPSVKPDDDAVTVKVVGTLRTALSPSVGKPRASS